MPYYNDKNPNINLDNRINQSSKIKNYLSYLGSLNKQGRPDASSFY